MKHCTRFAPLVLLLAIGCDEGSGGGSDVDGATAPDAGAIGAPDAAEPAPPPDAGPVDASPLADLGVERPVARRIMTWVCDTGYGDEAGPAELELAGLAGGDAVVGLDPADAPCQFHLQVEAPDEAPVRLSDAPGGYLLAAGVERAGVRAVCASNIVHRAAADDDRGDPSGRLARRETTGVSIECAVGTAAGWLPLQTVVPADPARAPWVVALTDLGDGRYQLVYDHDFSFQFLNLTQRGRPEGDGTYEVEFTVVDDELEVGEARRAAEELVGAPDNEPDPEACPAGVIDPDDPRCAPRCGDGSCDPGETCADCADCGPCALAVDDADDPGYRELDGEWRDGPGLGDFSRWTESGTAAFTFDGLMPGWKTLSVHHPVDPGNAARAVYRVREGERVVAELVEDQRVGAEDWRALGTFPSQGDFVVEVSSAGGGRLYADAVRVEQVAAPAPVVDDGDALYRELDGEWTTEVGGHGGDHRSAPRGVAEFALPIRPGVHAIALHYPSVPLASGRVEATLRTDGRFVATVLLDQRNEGGDWLELGAYRLEGQRVSLTLAGQDPRPVLADAVRVTPAAFERDGEQQVDDGDARFVTDGEWAPAAGGGREGDAAWTRDPEARATWQFTGLAPDFYDVLVQWPAAPENTQVATYVFSSGGAELGRVVADQTRAGDGWTRVGTVWAAGPEISVQVSGAASGTLYADAIKLVSTSCADCAR